VKALAGHASIRTERRPFEGDERRIDHASQKRGANEFMREGLQHFDQAEPIPFFCECDRHRCYDVVWLTGSEYDERRAMPTGGRSPAATTIPRSDRDNHSGIG
jgi:hypothetical protein